MEKYIRYFKEDEEEHYSDKINKVFIKNGWKLKDGYLNKVFFNKERVGGEINPSGKVKVSAKFEEPKMRYFVVSVGWDEADWDGREYENKPEVLLKDVEKEIDNYLSYKKSLFVKK